MILNLKFSKENSFKPFVVITSNGEVAEIRRPRWVQFLSLLAYRRLTNMEKGWITLDDLSCLISFYGVKPKAIGRYLADTYVRLSPLIYRFLNGHLDITTTGPYVLILDREMISTDLTKLGEYLEWITLHQVGETMDHDALYHASFSAQHRNEYVASMQLIKQFIKAEKSSNDVRPDALAVGYFRLANLERLIRSNTVDIKSSIDSGIRWSAEIKLSKERHRMKVYANIIIADTMKINKHSLPKLLKLNGKTIELINTVQKDIPYKDVILCGRYMQNLRELFIHSKIISQKDLKHIYDISRSSKQFELLEDIEMYEMLMQKELQNETVTTSDLSRYDSLLARDSFNNLRTFGLGWKIRRSLVNANRLDEAYHFGQKCLLEHAMLYQGAVYRDRSADQNRLGEALNQ